MTDVIDIQRAGRRRGRSISLCMIARDEEQTIGRAIESVRGLVDEIIVVDTGSADETAAVASELGASVFAVAWRNDFAAARNEAVDRATGGWILVLDADEEIDEAGRRRIRSIVDRNESGGWRFEQRTYTDDDSMPRWRACEPSERTGGDAGYFTNRQIRLFPGGGRIRYAGAVAESVETSLAEAGLPVQDGDIVVHHHGRIGPPGRVARKCSAWCALGDRAGGAGDGHAPFLFELAIQLLAFRRPEASLDLVRGALAEEPNAWALLDLQGLALLQCGKREAALDSFRSAIAAAGMRPDLCNNCGVAFLELERNEEALACLESGLAVAGRHAGLLRNAAAACLALDRSEAARVYADSSLEIDPFSAEGLLLRAEALFALGDSPGAVECLAKTRFLPDVSLAFSLRAIHLLLRTGDVAAVAKAVERTKRRHPGHAGLLFLEGKVREMQGNDDAAAMAYERALAGGERRPGILNALGCIRERCGRLDEAKRLFEEGLAKAPLDPQIETNLAIVAGKNGRFDDAERRLRGTLERHPGFAPALNALGCLLANGGRFAEAAGLFADAVESDPENGSYYLNLGLVSEMLHRPGRAAAVYERAIRRVPGAGPLVGPRLERLRRPACRS